jgi:prevent-host-death family protein
MAALLDRRRNSHYCSEVTHATLTIPAAEANRQFSKLLRAVREGARVIITSHGEPVAQLGPPDVQADEAARLGEALAALESQWAGAEPAVVGAWTRDNLYDRDPASD